MASPIARLLPSKRVRWSLIAALSVVLVAVLVQCSSPPPRTATAPSPAVQPPASTSALALTPAQIATLTKQAESGSGPAAYQLSLHYEAAQHDTAEAMRWMKKSADNGDVGGMHGYALYLKSSNDPKDKALARQYLQKVMAQGDEFTKTVAGRELREMDAEQKAGK